MGLPTAEAEAVLQAYIGVASFTGPADLHLAACTTSPDAATAGVEPTDSAYARLHLEQPACWTDNGDGTATNADDLLFTAASEDWGDITSVELWTDPTAVTTADRYGFGDLTATVSIASGQTLRFQAGTITVQVA